MSKIKVIVFDLAGVVIDIWHKFVNLIPDMKNLPKNVFEEITHGETYQRFQMGKYSEEEFLKKVKELTGTSATIEELKKIIRFVMSEIAGARSIITKLRECHKVALLTNFPKEWFEYVDSKYGLSKLFDAIFVSAYTGVKKPNKEAYNLVFNHFKALPEECLLVDDKERNVKAAEQLGMETIHFTNVPSFVKVLQERLKIEFGNPLNIFRAYDVRGIYSLDLDEKIVEKIGLAFGNLVGEGKYIAVGKDLRSSGESLKKSLISGLNYAGCNVVDIGTVPVPLLYFAVVQKGLDAGAMVTGSHLTPGWNGIKFCREAARPVSYDTGIGQMKQMIINGSLKTSKRFGTIKKENILEEYITYIRNKFHLHSSIKIVVDVGNGTCGEVAQKIFSQTNCEAIFLFSNPDENFPNHIPDPMLEETLKVLQHAVIDESADLGIAFDGDGDRVGFVDDKGRIIPADVATMIFAKNMLEKTPASKILFDVRCTKALYDYVKMLGGMPQFIPIGHSLIKRIMLEEGAQFAGEGSGHFFFAENFGYDDAFFAALKMIEFVANQKRKVSEIVDKLPKYFSTPVIKVPYSDEKKFDLINLIKQKILEQKINGIFVDGVRVEFDDGWFLIRASNTEPMLILRAEAKTQERLEELKTFVKQLLDETAGIKIVGM
jgi:phosphomannomutase/phosphoglucomutase